MCVKCEIWDHSLIFSLVCFIFVVESLVTGMMFIDTIEILLVRELFWMCQILLRPGCEFFFPTKCLSLAHAHMIILRDA